MNELIDFEIYLLLKIKLDHLSYLYETYFKHEFET